MEEKRCCLPSLPHRRRETFQVQLGELEDDDVWPHIRPRTHGQPSLPRYIN
jgi:hypothetical protein